MTQQSSSQSHGFKRTLSFKVPGNQSVVRSVRDTDRQTRIKTRQVSSPESDGRTDGHTDRQVGSPESDGRTDGQTDRQVSTSESDRQAYGQTD